MYLVVGYIFIILYFGKFRKSQLWINIHSKKNIKINLFYSENSKNFQIADNKENPALLSQGRANFSGRSEASSFPPQQREVLCNSTSGQIKQFKTFSIILPNLIHKSKKMDLKH